LNVRKDVVHVAFSAGSGGASSGGSNGGASSGGSNGGASSGGASSSSGGGSSPNCGFANGTNPWTLPAVQYLPDPTTRTSTTPSNMGFPRDICHSVSSAGDCSAYNGGQASRFGDGNWDRTTYFNVNHSAADLTAAQNWTGRTNATRLTRYDVYRWELATSGMLNSRQETGSTTNYSYGAPQCATGVGETTTQKDRRVITAAVVDCVAGGVKGSTAVKVKSWIDLFLVEPSLARSRTSADQIYVEIIGSATKPGGGNAFQYYSRNKPYLIK